MADEFIYIKHPDIAVLGGPVARSSLSMHEQRGWVEATAEEVALHEEGKLQRQAEIQALTPDAVDSIRKRADLDALAVDIGIDPTQHDNMTSLADAIKATL
jgi:hypothetical protein